jgi:hypothetical protein
MGQSIQAPICAYKLGPAWIDAGTLVRSRECAPGIAGAIRPSSSQFVEIPSATVHRLKLVIETAMPMMPSKTRDKLAALLTPDTLATLVAILAVWGAAQFVALGEVVDVVLVGVGIVSLGREAIDVARNFVDFAQRTQSARNAADIQRAAESLTKAMSAVGVDVLVILLTRRAASSATLAVDGVAVAARLGRATERLERLVKDEDRLLRLLAEGARSLPEKEALVSWLARMEEQVPNFRGRPALRLTSQGERWFRASDSMRGETVLKDRITGRKLEAYDDGAYLAKEFDRSRSAILEPFNAMTIGEEPLVPAGSIVLDGFAAPQARSGAWATSGQHLPGGGRQIFHAGQLGPNCRLMRPARSILDSHRLGPDGRRRPDE